MRDLMFTLNKEYLKDLVKAIEDVLGPNVGKGKNHTHDKSVAFLSESLGLLRTLSEEVMKAPEPRVVDLDKDDDDDADDKPKRPRKRASKVD